MTEEVKTKVTNDAEQLEKEGKKMPSQQELLEMQLQYYPMFLYNIEKTLKGMKAKEIVPALVASLQFASNNQKVLWVKDGKVSSGKENTHNLFLMLQEAIKIKTHVDTLRAVAKAKEAVDKFKEAQEAADKENNSNLEGENNNG